MNELWTTIFLLTQARTRRTRTEARTRSRTRMHTHLRTYARTHACMRRQFSVLLPCKIHSSVENVHQPSHDCRLTNGQLRLYVIRTLAATMERVQRASVISVGGGVVGEHTAVVLFVLKVCCTKACAIEME